MSKHRSRLLDEDGIIIASTEPGEVGKQMNAHREPEPKMTPLGDSDEKLLPTDVQANENYDPNKKANPPGTTEDEEGQAYMLPPISQDRINQQDTATIAKNRPVASDQEPLFPLGVNPNNKN